MIKVGDRVKISKNCIVPKGLHETRIQNFIKYHNILYKKRPITIFEIKTIKLLGNLFFVEVYPNPDIYKYYIMEHFETSINKIEND